MTLSEEIKKVLLSTGLVFDEKRTDEIIKLFEKMIDSVQENKEELDYQNGWSGDAEFWDGYEIGFEQAFKLMKEKLSK